MRMAPTATAANIVEDMIKAALASEPLGKTFDGLIRSFRNQGFEIDRAHLSHPTLHPLYRGAGYYWTVENGLQQEHFTADEESEEWLRSPVRHAITHDVDRMRRRLSGPGAMRDFPIFDQLHAQGMTDYFLLAAPFDGFRAPMRDVEAEESLERSGMICTFATRRPEGFSDEEIMTLEWLRRPFGVLVKVADQRRVAEALAECYIGREAGPRVLQGAIRRGDFASTEAVVWLSDLRDSTAMSSSMPRAEFIGALNDFFDATVGAVQAEGGEAMNFSGDSALAIFPIAALGSSGARHAALRAATRAREAVGALNAVRAAGGRRGLDWGLALHAGVVDYGNIGSLTRHSWSVIGPVVNETSRLEGLTKTTGEPMVASRKFVDGLGVDAAAWRRMGAFDLTGVPLKFEVFAPPRGVDEKESAA